MFIWTGGSVGDWTEVTDFVDVIHVGFDTLLTR